MQITQHTDYAFRTLIYLALKDGEKATIGEIAQSYGISRNHLNKVVNRLHQHGHAVATRGKNGGLRLARPPESINLGKVFRDMEKDIGVVECLRGSEGCPLHTGCELKRTFAAATSAFVAVLDGRHLSDLLSGPASMRQVLAISS